MTQSLLYIVYGADTYHREALFSIASACAQLARDSGAGERIDIQVWTDRPEPYQGLPVAVQALSPEQLQAWRGPHGYHFRAKHAVLREALRAAERAILIDTDTFFHTSPSVLFSYLQPGALLCNRIGPAYGERREETLYVALASRLQQRGQADDGMPMLNSGVIGLCREDACLLDHSLALMDELFPHAQGAYTLEEFVLAVACRAAGLTLKDCADDIHHYWSRKALFRAKIDAWLQKHRDRLLSPDALADTFRISSELPRPPSPTRLRMKLITCLLPRAQRQFARELLYGCYPYPNEFDRACGPVWWEKAAINLRERDAKAAPAAWLRNPLLRMLLGSNAARITAHLKAQGLLDAPH